MSLANVIKSRDVGSMGMKAGVKKVKTNTAVSFEEVVNSIPDLLGGYCKGLQAMKTDSTRIKPVENKFLSGSVDIDSCTKSLYPNAARWDYAIGYKEKAYFIEVHPANTSNIKEMLRKADWLKSWLKGKGKVLDQIKKDENLYWVPSGKVAIPKTSPQFRNLAKKKLRIENCPFVLQ